MFMTPRPIDFGRHRGANRRNWRLFGDEVQDFSYTLALNRIQNLNGRAIIEFENATISRLPASGSVKDGAIELYRPRRRMSDASVAGARVSVFCKNLFSRHRAHRLCRAIVVRADSWRAGIPD